MPLRHVPIKILKQAIVKGTFIFSPTVKLHLKHFTIVGLATG
jgi:hypothetical protein